MSSSTIKTVRKESQDRRKVYKNVLDSPFNIKWPNIADDLADSILKNLIAVLEPIGRAHRERKNERPEISKRVHIGLNDVTRYLEQRIRSQDNNNNNEVIGVFVCRRDMQPSHLCNHLLTMACLANAKLVSLPAGSETKLATALGLQRASAVAIEIKEGQEESLRLDVVEVPLVEALWLTRPTTTVYEPTHIKVLQTTAPIKKSKRKNENSSSPSQPNSGKKTKR